MKIYLCAPIIGLLVLFTSGCQSDKSYRDDEAKTVARVIASEAGSAVAFADQKGVEHILSSLDKSEYLDFGIVLDGQKHVIASYLKPAAGLQKDVVVAQALQSLGEHNSDVLTRGHGLVFAIAPIGVGGQPTGYVIVGRVDS